MSRLSSRLLWRRVRDYLERYQPLLIAVIGTSAPPVTTRAIALALQGQRRVRANETIVSNPVAVAQALLGEAVAADTRGWFNVLTDSLVTEIADDEPDTIVLPLTAHRPGELDWLTQHITPQLLVMTDVGTAHVDYFTSTELMGHELLAFPAAATPETIALLTTDDPLVAGMAEHTQASTLMFGRSDDAHVRLLRTHRLAHHGLAAEIRIDRTVRELHLQHVVGQHQLRSILAALAVAHTLQLDLDSVCERLQLFIPPAGHLQLRQGQRGSLVLDDSLGGTPEQLAAGLETLRALPARRRIAVLGDLTTLAGQTSNIHTRLGKQAGQVAQIVVGVGPQMQRAAAEAVLVGADVHHFSTASEAAKWLPDFIGEGDLVYVGGSPEMKLEQVVERLLAAS